LPHKFGFILERTVLNPFELEQAFVRDYPLTVFNSAGWLVMTSNGLMMFACQLQYFVNLKPCKHFEYVVFKFMDKNNIVELLGTFFCTLIGVVH
jgi:hypothetical protein